MLDPAALWRRTAKAALAGALAVGLAVPLTGMTSTGAQALPKPALDVPTDQTSLVLNYFNDYTLNNVRDADEPLPSNTRVYLLDSEGTLWNTAAGANELIVFPGIAAGEAKIMYSGGSTSGKAVTDANGNRLALEAGPGAVETHKIDENTGEITVSNLNLTGNYFTAAVNIADGQVTEHQAAVSTTRSAAQVTIVDADGSVIDADPSLDFSFTNGTAELTAQRPPNNAPGRYLVVDGSGSASGISAPALSVHAPAGYEIHSATASAGNTAVPVAVEGASATVQTTDLPRRASSIDWKIAFVEATEPQPTTELTVKYWSDRVVDGVYDTSVTDEAGRVDTLPATSGLVYVIDANGTYWSTGAGEDGQYRFPGIAEGEAKVLMGVGNEESTVQSIDGVNLPATREHYTQPVTYIDPATGEHRESRVGGQLLFEGTTTVAADGNTAEFRGSYVRTNAEITLDGEAVTSEYATVEFANNSQWFDTGVSGTGTYFYPLHFNQEAAGTTNRAQSMGADTVTLKAEAAEGYVIESVTPTNGGTEIPVVDNGDGTYSVATTDLTTNFDIIKWNVVVAEAPAGASAVVEFWNDRVVDGVFDTSVTDESGRTDAPNTGYVYLQDADGKWWSTTADADGKWNFPGIAEGEAKVFFTLSNDRGTVMNADDNHLARTTEPRGTTGVTYINPTTGERVENTRIPVSGTYFEGAVTAATEEQDSFAFRSTLVMTNATVTVDGETADADLAQVTFSNNDDVFETVRNSSGLHYPKQPGDTAAQQAFGAHDFGIAVEVADGYELVSVSATNSGEDLPFVDNGDGSFTVATTDLGTSFDVVRWAIEVAPIPPVTELSVQYFNDGVVDGVFDTSKQNADGSTDRLNSTGYVYLQDAAGDWYSTAIDEDGRYTFTDVADGEAKVFFTLSNSRQTVQNADDEHLARTSQHGGQPVTFINPTTGETVNARIPQSITLLEGTATVPTAGESADVAQFRSTMIHTNATVTVDGASTPGAADLVFANNGDAFETAANASGVHYPVHPGTTAQQAFGAKSFSLTVTPAEGYEIAQVTATSSGKPVDVAASGTTYNVQTESLGSSFAVVTWSVELVEVKTVTSVEYWMDRVVDGEYDTSVRDIYGYTDAHHTGYVYLRDAEGSWFATTLNADGLHTFVGAAEGDAQVFFMVPGGNATVQDAANEHLSATRDHAGTPVTVIDPVTGEETGTSVIPATDLFESTVTVPSAGAAANASQFRSSSVHVSAQVEMKGKPDNGKKAEVAFFNNDQVFEGERGKKAVFTTDQVFGADVIGVGVQVDRGYEIVSVSAVNGGTSVKVENLGDGIYAVNTADLGSSFDDVEFDIEIKKQNGGPFSWIGNLFAGVIGWVGDLIGGLSDWLSNLFGRP